MDNITPNTALAVINYTLCVTDEEPLDFVSASLEAHVERTAQEVERLKEQNAALSAKMNKALHTAAFNFPDIARMLRDKANELATLEGQVHIPDHIDPFTNRDEEAVLNEQEQIEERRAEEERIAALEGLKTTKDGKLLEKECKRIFRFISSKSHPDKSVDRSLHEAFRIARHMLRSLDLPGLAGLETQVRDYLKMRKKNKNFQQFLENRLRQHKLIKEQVLQENYNIRNSVQYRVLASIERDDPKHLQRLTYLDLVANVVRGMQHRINQLNAQHKHDAEMFRQATTSKAFRPSDYPPTFT